MQAPQSPVRCCAILKRWGMSEADIAGLSPEQFQGGTSGHS
jgi:hypothetical protein